MYSRRNGLKRTISSQTRDSRKAQDDLSLGLDGRLVLFLFHQDIIMLIKTISLGKDGRLVFFIPIGHNTVGYFWNTTDDTNKQRV